MKKIAKFLFILFIINWFPNCSKEDVYVPPSAVTVKSETMPSGGVQLYGDFRNFVKNDIVGFEVYGNNFAKNFIIDNPKNGENSIIINDGLYFNQTYKYRAYIRSNSEFYYGLEESFKSTGSLSPGFKSLNPNEGDFGDEVELVVDKEITVSRLSDIAIMFNNEKTYPSSVENSIITLNVPYFTGNEEADIKVDYFGKVIQTSLKYRLLAPTITSVSPKEVTFGDEITITGTHFEDQNSQFLKVFVNNHEAIVVSKNKTNLVVKVPNDIEKKQVSIKVVSNLQEVVKEDVILMKSPKITDYSTSGYINDYLVLNGENFNPDLGRNEVYFENRKAAIVNGNGNSITVQIPDGVFSNWNPSISIKVSDELVSTDYPFTILDAMIRIKENLELEINGYQEINNEIYVYGIDGYEPNELVIKKFNPETSEFYDKNVVDMPSTSSPFFINTNSGNVYMYFNKESSNFYKINLVAAVLEQLPNFPAPPRRIIQVASFDGSIYVGGGSTNTTYNNIDYTDFHAYNISNKTWSQKPDLPFSKYPTTHYNIYAQNISFVIKGAIIYKFNGEVYEKLNTSVELPYDYFSTYNYVYKDNLFYMIEGRANIRKNRMRIFNSQTYELTEIVDALPNRYDITGIFKHKNYIFMLTTDSQLKKHLLKFDLEKL